MESLFDDRAERLASLELLYGRNPELAKSFEEMKRVADAVEASVIDAQEPE